MGLEIERKFKVKSEEFRKMSSSCTDIRQGYLSRDPMRTVRVRVRCSAAGSLGYITVKGITSGAVREEYEYEIPAADAERMLSLCEGRILSKTRWIVPYGDHLWEVDEFHGDLSPLIVAEVELSAADEAVSLPPFVGEEVTGDARYYNSSL